MASKRWLRIRAESPSPERTDELAEGLIACGAEHIEHVQDALIVYACDIEDPVAYTHALQTDVAKFLGTPVALWWEWVEDQDWAKEWRRGLDARRVGKHFVVTPTWIEPVNTEGDVVITIDPQMAFGTGEHATTRGMLRLMEATIKPGDTVLDVGAGSAILAIAAVLLGAEHADAVESDIDAIENATENIERNGVAEAVRLTCEIVDDAFLAAHLNRYDVIVANVLSGVLRPLLPSFRSSLRSGGRLLLSGILREEADGMVEAAAASGFRLVQDDREDEWWSGLLTPDPST